ncbi:hypothetical protein ACFZA2_14085 [Microbacterium sp. NPDC007973]|uniref:hypothetical protein n=1 Tax=Microbacterium sp. NPDC007973 TaxID=3364182 RepID=UPI0036ECE9E1
MAAGAPAGNKNRATHSAVTELVALYLDAEGIDATANRRPARLSDRIGDVRPDISAKGVAVTVTSRLDHRLHTDLGTAVATGRLAGADISALVQWRASRDISEAYTVMTLSDFAKLLRLARPA